MIVANVALPHGRASDTAWLPRAISLRLKKEEPSLTVGLLPRYCYQITQRSFSGRTILSPSLH